MPAQQQSNRKLLYLILGAASLVFGYFMTSSDDSSAAVTVPKPHAYSASAASADNPIYPEDYKVHFASLTTPSHDVFEPLIARKSATKGASNKQNAIPPECAGGDPNWSFTGSAVLDNVPQANFQNDKSGEFDQVNKGQHWKTSTVAQITPEYVVFDGPSGKKKVLMPADVAASAQKVVANTQPNVAPVNPLAGQIGQDQEAAAAAVDAAAAAAQMQGFGAGGWGGGRRGRGGRGGGWGGGGRGGGGFGGGRGGGGPMPPMPAGGG